jgi:hypothetical protein
MDGTGRSPKRLSLNLGDPGLQGQPIRFCSLKSLSQFVTRAFEDSDLIALIWFITQGYKIPLEQRNRNPNSPLTVLRNRCTSSTKTDLALNSSSNNTFSSTNRLYLLSISKNEECAFLCSRSRSSLPCSRRTTVRFALSRSEVKLSIES